MDNFILVCTIIAAWCTFTSVNATDLEALQNDLNALRNISLQQEEAIDDLKAEINSQILQNHGIHQKHENKIHMLLEELSHVTKDHATERRASEESVSFYVQLSHDELRLGNHQIIPFDNVTTNNGNAYNPVDGIFRVPYNGNFVFAWTTTNKDRSFMNTELVVDTNVVGMAMADAMDHNDYAVASNIAVLTLNAGQEVWVRSGTWHNGVVAGEFYTTFSGWFLF